MKPALCIALAVLLALPVQARQQSPQEQASKIKLGDKVEVTLQSDEVLKGRRGPSTATGFSLEPLKDGAAPARSLEFQDVKRISRTGLNTPEKVAIIAGVAIAGLALTIFLWAKASGC